MQTIATLALDSRTPPCWPIAVIFTALVAGSGSACTTALYSGPDRGRANTAIISSGSGTTITAIDRTPVNGGRFGEYEVLPGQHRMWYGGQMSEAGFFTTTIHTSERMGACFVAKPGHKYEVRATLDSGEYWTSQVVDAESLDTVPTSMCGTEDIVGKNAAKLEQTPRPQMALLLGMMGDIGGDDLISATMSNGDNQKLAAGTGYGAFVGGTATPWWIGNAVAIGVGTQIGIKYDSIDAKNGSVGLIRYPLALWLQNYIALDDKWYFSLGFGAHKDLGAKLSGDGVASGVQADFQSAWGWMAEGGVLWADSWHLGLGFSLRYTKLQYSVGANTIDASHVGFRFTFHMMR